MDVTDQILSIVRKYGSSDDTNPAYSSSNRTLDYSVGGSISRPELNDVGIIPFQINYQDTVGLFGKENHFVRVNLNIDTDRAFACFEEDGWECATVTTAGDFDRYYEEVIINQDVDLETVNTFDPARFNRDSLPAYTKAFVSVELDNLKTGNKYIDNWLDMRLYTKTREEHPYDQMYCGLNDFFYIGFHARNTRRLPYNIKCTIGDEYTHFDVMTDEQKRYIPKIN